MSLFSVAAATARQTVLDIHGETLTHRPAGAAVASFTGVIYDPAREGEAAPGVLLVVGAPLSEFSVEPEKNDFITIGETDYRVFDKKSESGWLMLSLRK